MVSERAQAISDELADRAGLPHMKLESKDYGLALPPPYITIGGQQVKPMGGAVFDVLGAGGQHIGIMRALPEPSQPAPPPPTCRCFAIGLAHHSPDCKVSYEL